MNAQATSTVDFAIWESRWQALSASIESYEAVLNGAPDSSTGILKSMLVNLQTFAEKQFHFFHNGFANHYTPGAFPNSYTLQPSTKYPPEYVLGVTLKQVAYDLEVTQRAAEQRIWASQSGNTEVDKTLNRADHIAQEALEAVFGTGLVEGGPPTVITYFEKSHSVRFCPHSPVALLSIPFSCIADPGTNNPNNQHITPDYITLLHELGHYIFWHSKVNDQYIHKTLYSELRTMKAGDSWCYKWVEEIFADVFGCWLGGHVIALSAQDLASVATGEEFTEDDRQHPIPAIRPQVYIETLKRIQPSSAMCNEELTTLWENYKAIRLEPTETGFTVVTKKETPSPSEPTHETRRIEFTDAVPKMNEVIDRVLGLLHITERLAWPGAISNLGVTRDNLKYLLNTRFRGYISSKDTTPLSKPPLSQLQEGDWANWVDNNEFLEEKLSWYKETSSPIPEIVEKETDRRGWLNILYAGGWSTGIGTNNPCVKED